MSHVEGSDHAFCNKSLHYKGMETDKGMKTGKGLKIEGRTIMKKNRKVMLLAAAVAVMLAATGCGTKNKGAEEETSAKAATQAQSQQATADETAVESSTAMSGETLEESEDEVGESVAAAETESPPVGSLGADGIYQSDSGRYKITLPKGWSMDGGSDKSYVTYISPSGDDTLDIVDLTGSDIDSEREEYPDTAEEYQNMVSRGDGMKILSYNVKSGDDGSQTFQYTAQYDNPDDGVYFRAVSGAYNAKKQTYICATGNVSSAVENEKKQVGDAVLSLKTN